MISPSALVLILLSSFFLVSSYPGAKRLSRVLRPDEDTSDHLPLTVHKLKRTPIHIIEATGSNVGEKKIGSKTIRFLRVPKDGSSTLINFQFQVVDEVFVGSPLLNVSLNGFLSPTGESKVERHYYFDSPVGSCSKDRTVIFACAPSSSVVSIEGLPVHHHTFYVQLIPLEITLKSMEGEILFSFVVQVMME
ncbi:hypothetical protein PMAYCL1PPCAC_04158 [Pristionchus mayeri]|uniref:Uncharacterized protein n=1 Tax=Pristionchus mayeri TaxID=1317129 RepID=A0AAN5C208_9BILA|nr:hypothetical protein PMAYCL1PPCAC_04158 [Pristionchus mayeri]